MLYAQIFLYIKLSPQNLKNVNTSLALQLGIMEAKRLCCRKFNVLGKLHRQIELIHYRGLG